MIYTLTLNPSIDYVIDVENLELGKVNRTSKDFKFPGGKGINVSRILGNQKIDNIALGFLGGFTGKFIEDNLKALGVKTEFIKVKVVVDTSGKALLEAIKNKPFLIKPNNHEIEEIFDVKINSEKELIKYGKDLVSLGAENVIISMAGDGALLITKDGVFKGNAPKGEVKNSVGAGDSLVGGFLAKYVETKDLIASFKNGIASGSASAFSLDLALAEDVNKLLPIIKIEKYEEV